MALFQPNKFVPAFIVAILIFTDGSIGIGSDCTSSICQETGEEIINSIDNTVDPCTDFYQHACGGWIVKHPVSNSEQSSSQITLIERKVEQQLKVLLENEDADDTGVVRKAKKFYRSCRDLAAIDSKGLQPFLTILTANGDWPLTVPLNQWNPKNLTWLQIHETLGKLSEAPGFFQLFLTVDKINSINYHKIALDPIQPPGKRPSSTPEAYKKYVLNVALIFTITRSSNVPLTDMVNDVEALIEFETELNDAYTKDTYYSYNGRDQQIITIKEAQNIWDSAVNNNPQYKIDWLETVNRRFEGSGIVINENELLVISPGNYLHKLAVVISKTPIRTIVNYIHWFAIERLLTHGNSVLRGILLQYLSETKGIKKEAERWRTCLKNHVMDEALSFMYAKSHLSVLSIISVSQMTRQLRKAAKQQIDSSTWLDENAKNSSKEKIDGIVDRIGYPDWYDEPGKLDEIYSELTIGSDYFENVLAVNQFKSRERLLDLLKPVNASNEWPLAATTVSASYIDSSNTIYFPAALIQMPLYHDEKPAALRFGGLGAIIGHIIAHGFHNIGRLEDKDGTKRHWWSGTVINDYTKKIICFIEQYKKYEITKSSITNETIYVNEILTLNKNMYDNIGFSMGFKAFQQYKSSHPSETDKIPALQNYSDEKLYFYGLANVTDITELSLCDVMQPAYLENTYPKKQYAPNKVRVNGALSNMEEFANAFACPFGSKMNPTHKCVMWD